MLILVHGTIDQLADRHGVRPFDYGEGINMRTTLNWIALCGAALFAASVDGTYGAEFRTLSAQQILGEDVRTRARFSAEAGGDHVRIVISLPNRKSIVALINYNHESIQLRSVVTGTDRATSLTQFDLELIDKLRRSVGEPRHRIGDALTGILSLLSEAPAGVLNIDTSDREGRTRGKASTYTPLCGVSTSIGTFDIPGQTFTTNVTGLGCYTAVNQCLGRCGPGCGTVQRITRECLNHDLCRRETGLNQGPCGDEWLAAGDSLLFAPDCASLTGTWDDIYGIVTRLTQGSVETLSGRATNVPDNCPMYRIRNGTHRGANFEFTASLVDPEPACCMAYTYRGTIGRSCNRASVAWTNSCGFMGTTPFTRRSGARIETVKQLPLLSLDPTSTRRR
jgi:hypothetical protein